MKKKRRLLIWGTGEDSTTLLNSFPIINITVDKFIDSNKNSEMFYGRKVLLPSEVEWNKSKFIIIATRKYYDEIALYLNDKGLHEEIDYIGYSEKIWDKLINIFFEEIYLHRINILQRDIAIFKKWIPDIYSKMITNSEKITEYIYEGNICPVEAIIASCDKDELEFSKPYDCFCAETVRGILESLDIECKYYNKLNLLRINASVSINNITKIELYSGSKLLGELLLNIYVDDERNGAKSKKWNCVFTKVLKELPKETFKIKIFYGLNEDKWIFSPIMVYEVDEVPYCYKTIIGTKNGITVNDGMEREFYNEYKNKPELRRLCIETSSICNLRCQYCLVGHNYEAIERNTVSKSVIDEAIRIINQFSTIDVIQLNALGEPLIYSDFAQLCERIYYETNVRNVLFFTNGMLLEKEVVRRLTEIPLNYKVFFSIDGRTPDENGILRVGSEYEKIKNNMYYLFYQIAEKVNWEIGINNLQMVKENEGVSIPKFLLNDFGFIKIDSHRTFYFPELSREKLLNKGIFVHEKKNKKVCKRSFLEATIRHNGDVIRCHWDSKCEEIMGNILEQPFREIWYGEKYKRMREGMNPNVPISELPESCQKCHAMNEGYLYKA